MSRIYPVCKTGNVGICLGYQLRTMSFYFTHYRGPSKKNILNQWFSMCTHPEITKTPIHPVNPWVFTTRWFSQPPGKRTRFFSWLGFYIPFKIKGLPNHKKMDLNGPAWWTPVMIFRLPMKFNGSVQKHRIDSGASMGFGFSRAKLQLCWDSKLSTHLLALGPPSAWDRLKPTDTCDEWWGWPHYWLSSPSLLIRTRPHTTDWSRFALRICFEKSSPKIPDSPNGQLD